MIYTVVWTEPALNALVTVWMAASDRGAVTAAANWIDHELRIDPDEKGEPHRDGRLFVALPLAVTFRISADDRMVTVLQLQRFPA